MNTLEQFRKNLLDQKATLERELKTVGRINPENKDDWQPTPPPIDVMRSDITEVAEEVEEFEGRFAVEAELEVRLAEINDALARIEAGAYGKCRVCGEEIEEARLNANPAAETCKAHINE